MADRNVQRRIDRARRRQLRRALLRVLRERLALVSGGVLVILLLTGTLGYSYVHAQVYDDTCRPIPEVDLALSQMADISRQLKEYQVDPARDAHIELASDESSFVFAQFVDFDVRLRVFGGDQVSVRAAVPQPSGCVLVDAEGTLTVSGQRATFVPSRVRLGELDVTGLGLPVGEVSYEPADLEDQFPRLAEQLANVDSLEVAGDAVHVRLIDRYKLF